MICLDRDFERASGELKYCTLMMETINTSTSLKWGRLNFTLLDGAEHYTLKPKILPLRNGNFIIKIIIIKK